MNIMNIHNIYEYHSATVLETPSVVTVSMWGLCVGRNLSEKILISVLFFFFSFLPFCICI